MFWVIIFLQDNITQNNYKTNLSRLKSQVPKLKQNPFLLEEYNNITKVQLESGIKEHISELEEKDYC